MLRSLPTKKFAIGLLPFAVVALLAAGAILLRGGHQKVPRVVGPATSVASSSETALAIVLSPLKQGSEAEREIAALQKKISEATDRHALLERLGWAFINEARVTSDPGFYKLAEQCTVAMGDAGSPYALLLRGHLAHALHRFQEAETIARQLVNQREFVLDFALLGDALMEQGKLAEAVVAYQKMVDLKPCLQTYSRVAHMRWLKGDLPGAIEVMRLAVSSGSPREPEPVAWACTQLARYEMQDGAPDLAAGAIDAALQSVPEYRAALLARGRLLESKGLHHEAIPFLQRAAAENPLPEYLWTLSDALQADARPEEAEKIDGQIMATGAANDPRTFSLFLASRRVKTDQALALAKDELTNRQDVFTQDALAWAEFSNGEIAKAQTDIAVALAEGTQDARLFLHAGQIAAASGRTDEARSYFQKAQTLSATLMPSERTLLAASLASLSRRTTDVAALTDSNTPTTNNR